jgi:tRNA 2-thiouridine synthesizing protein A
MDRLHAIAYPGVMHWDQDIDARGMICPLPVLKARKRLLAMAPGAILRLRATDPAAVVDVPHFCREAGHNLLATSSDGATTAYFIRRGGTSQPD